MISFVSRCVLNRTAALNPLNATTPNTAPTNNKDGTMKVRMASEPVQ